MGYVSMGDVSSENFNSTKYPGVCKPSNVEALATFKRCQAQLNRVAQAKGFKTIAVDGDIGPGTVSLFGLLYAHLSQYAVGNNDISAASKITAANGSCVTIATYADVIANIADSFADELGAPAVASAPAATKTPTLVMPNGLEKPAPMGANLLASFNALPVSMKLLGLGIGAGIAYYTWPKSKRKSRR